MKILSSRYKLIHSLVIAAHIRHLTPCPIPQKARICSVSYSLCFPVCFIIQRLQTHYGASESLLGLFRRCLFERNRYNKPRKAFRALLCVLLLCIDVGVLGGIDAMPSETARCLREKERL